MRFCDIAKYKCKVLKEVLFVEYSCKMSFVNEKLTILYGSQTGNAQDLAERLWREAKRFYFACKVCSMDEYNVVELVQERCVIFICSTTGQGEEPDNMRNFWRFLLRRSLPGNSLVNVK